MTIKLQTGKEVYLEAFHCSPTYAGLLVGNPTKESNNRLIEQLSYPSDWGKKTSVLKKSDMFISENILKPMINCAWLSSSGINNEDNQKDSSSIVIIWFGKEPFDKSLKEIIVDGVGEIDWNKYAKDFQF